MIKWVIYAVLGGLSGVQLVVGNIEKVEFTGEIYTIQPKLWRRVNEQLNQLTHNQVTLLRHDSKNMERWYLLSNITQGERYECRISYGATTPTDFVMSLLRYDEVDSLLFTEQSSETELVEPVMETTQLILRVQAIYAGVSNLPNLSKQPVPYNIDSVDDKSRSNRQLHDQDGEDKDYDGDSESIRVTMMMICKWNR
ncbi:hypothetical protein BDF22DRAFT_655876 [Syncephalis plumigaleata]|nr:hypothetical protein BDF22DRAFT_655876 [Syncephalis plumigaleata]